MSQARFQRYSWLVLAFTLFVVLGGAFVRASVSGDGCGTNWPACDGQLLPQGDWLVKRFIEYGHRASTGLYLLAVLGLLASAFRSFPKGHAARTGTLLILGATIVEALVGALLVKFRWVARDESVYRAVAMSVHLVITFLLLAAVTLTIFWANGGGRITLRGRGGLPLALGIGLLATFLLGISGGVTALGDTLFPAKGLAEIGHTYGAGAHFLKSLRPYHPAIAIANGMYLALIASLCMRPHQPARVQQAARLTVTVFVVQMVWGFMNLAFLAPIWMQLIHLLLADIFWFSLVSLTANALSTPVSRPAETDADASPRGVPAYGARGATGAMAEALEPEPAARTTWKDYLALTKPRVISLLLFTTLTAMVIAAGAEHLKFPSGWLYLAVGLGLYMAAGAANAINMVLERDLDLAMGRTAKRPTVSQRISPRNAILFAAALGIGSFTLLWWSANLLSALMAQAGLAFYVLIYTLLLKRRTWTNIVIGGAAGAFPPLVGWAAVTGDLGPLAWCLFGIIFLWTPVHFWALALLIKEDYARAGVPMLPVVRGERATVHQIWCYAVLTVALSAVPLILPGPGGQQVFGIVYIAAAVVLNVVLLVRSAQLYRAPDHPHARTLFKFSMLYLALLFLAMAVDQAHWL